MSLRWRPMEPRDVAACVRLVAEHPVVGPRYGAQIRYLEPALRWLLGREAARTAVVEEKDARTTRMLAFATSVFVTDDFIREIKTPPLFWVAPELARRTTAGKSPVLSDTEVRAANSSQGLNVLVWEARLLQNADKSSIHRLLVEAYIQAHRGFLFKEMITAQSENAEMLQWSMEAGGLFWNAMTGTYVKSAPNMESAHENPHIVGMTREIESQRPGTWVGTLFKYYPPRFGFSRSEQKLLESALEGDRGTDQQLAEHLGVSLTTVKKMWLSIYRRVAEHDPDAIPGFPRTEMDSSQRGKEKRRLILAYLRDHPEELRPVSLKLLAGKNGNSKRRFVE